MGDISTLDGRSGAFRAHINADMIQDAERDAPELIGAVEAECPAIRAVVQDIRARVPLVSDAMVGPRGSFYRLPEHYRSVCLAIRNAEHQPLVRAAVIVFKGTEPLLPDFSQYLRWMMSARFRESDLSLGLHFPLVIKMPPAAMTLAEGRAEWEKTTAVHREHLQRYGTLAHAPVPLFLHRFSDTQSLEYVGELRRQLPKEALARIETRIRDGFAVAISYYPTAPIRVANLSTPAIAQMSNYLRQDGAATEVISKWVLQFARFLSIGYFPYAPWNQGWGSCVDSGNACVDGGFADLYTLVPISMATDAHQCSTAVLSSFEVFRRTVAQFVAHVRGADHLRTDLTFNASLGNFLRGRIVDILRKEEPTESVANALNCLSPSDLEAAWCAAQNATHRNIPYTFEEFRPEASDVAV